MEIRQHHLKGIIEYFVPKVAIINDGVRQVLLQEVADRITWIQTSTNVMSLNGSKLTPCMITLNIRTVIMLTCESWSWNFHYLSCLWGPGDVKKDVVITGVHVRSLEGGASQQSGLALRHLEKHVGDE